MHPRGLGYGILLDSGKANEHLSPGSFMCGGAWELAAERARGPRIETALFVLIGAVFGLVTLFSLGPPND